MALKWSIPSIMTARISAITYDTDAQAFFTAAGITDTTQKGAVNTLVLALKSASIWTKMVAIYPIVGGAASPHSYNLKNPSLYQLTFVGSPTHSSGGVDWNGSSQYADTGLNPSTVLTLNDSHIAYYSRENTTGGNDDFAVTTVGDPSTYEFRLLIADKATGNFYCDMYAFTTNGRFTVGGITDTRGLFVGSRLSSTDFAAYKNGSSIGSKTTSAGGFPNGTMYLGAANNTGTNLPLGAYNYSDRQCAFASVGLGLTSTDNSSLYTAVQNYQTTLGRQV